MQTGGVIRIQGDSRVEQLIQLECSVNKKDYSFSGYRIQILSVTTNNSNLDSLHRYCDVFEKAFPGVPSYLQYLDPDFKVRVGNFKTRLEAIPTLNKVRKKYPSSYIVKTTITLKELLRPSEEEQDRDNHLFMR